MTSNHKLDAITQYQHNLRSAGKLTPAVAEALRNARAICKRSDIIVYVAGALTGASNTDKQRYELVARTVQHITGKYKLFAYVPHMHGTDPVAHPDVTPEEVRAIDYLASTVIADAQLNFTHPLAHGSAIELAWAETAHIPAWLVTPDIQHTSRLIRGMSNVTGTITYHDFAGDGIEQVGALLQQLADTGQQ